MRLGVLGVLLVVCAGVFSPASAFAYNSRITIYAMVPEMRAVYINKDGDIYKIAGNTSRNLEPTVFSQDNKRIPMSDAINRQYQRFLKSHNYHLLASKIYLINPVSIDLTPDTQIIKVESSSPALSLGF